MIYWRVFHESNPGLDRVVFSPTPEGAIEKWFDRHEKEGADLLGISPDAVHAQPSARVQWRVYCVNNIRYKSAPALIRYPYAFNQEDAIAQWRNALLDEGVKLDRILATCEIVADVFCPVPRVAIETPPGFSRCIAPGCDVLFPEGNLENNLCAYCRTMAGRVTLQPQPEEFIMADPLPLGVGQ